MLRIKQDKTEIVIREIPLVIGLVYSALTVFLLNLVYFTFSTKAHFTQQFWSVGVSIGSVISLYLALSNSITTTKINKTRQAVSVRKQSLIRYSFDVYLYDEIADLISVDARERSRGGTIHQLIMPLKNGQKVELSMGDGSKNSQYFDAAILMNSYIFDTSNQIPFKLTVFNDG